MSVICFDEYELANVLCCADCTDDDDIAIMLDYSALNSACYRRQYREPDAVSIRRESLERAIDNCNPDPKRASETANLLHYNLVTNGGVLCTMFDMDNTDIMKEWTDSLRIQIRHRMRLTSALSNLNAVLDGSQNSTCFMGVRVRTLSRYCGPVIDCEK